MDKVLTQKPQVIVRDGKATGVVVDIRDFEALLERLEDVEDLREIRKIRESSPSFRSLEDVLGDRPLA